MIKRLRKLRATIWLFGGCLRTRVGQEIDIAADMLESKSGNYFHLVVALGFIWGFSGAICALAKKPVIYGMGDVIGMVLIKLLAVIFIPLSAVILVPAGRIYARRWHAKRKHDA